MSPKDDRWPESAVDVCNKPVKDTTAAAAAAADEQSKKRRGLFVKDAVKLLVLVDMFSVALVVSLLPSYFKDLTDRYYSTCCRLVYSALAFVWVAVDQDGVWIVRSSLLCIVFYAVYRTRESWVSFGISVSYSSRLLWFAGRLAHETTWCCVRRG